MEFKKFLRIELRFLTGMDEQMGFSKLRLPVCQLFGEYSIFRGITDSLSGAERNFFFHSKSAALVIFAPAPDSEFQARDIWHDVNVLARVIAQVFNTSSVTVSHSEVLQRVLDTKTYVST